jgi:hypothetical protein
MSDKFAVIPSVPPPGWERETPKYRVGFAVRPSPNSRFKNEPPFSSCSDTDVWQYAERVHDQGEIIETRLWPHASFAPLNYSAKKVLDFFKARLKSRLPRSPWHGDRIRLDDGLTGSAIVPTVVKPTPFDTRPQSAA